MNLLKKYILSIIFISLCIHFFAQTNRSNLYGIATIGQNPTLIYGDFNITSNGKMYLNSTNSIAPPTNDFYILGEYEGNNGSQIFITINEYSNPGNTPINIIGSAGGKTEININLFNTWAGERYDIARAYTENSDVETFTIDEIIVNQHIVRLKSRIEGNDIIWYIEDVKQECIDLIIQKKNHTLECNNNATTNGGYKFSYYKWYKNDELIHSGAYGEDRGGYYYTGKDENLDPNATYYVIATDQFGIEHYSCPFTPKLFNYPEHIIAYPNPAQIYNTNIVVDVLTEDIELLENGAIRVYNAIGQFIEEKKTEGHRYTQIHLPEAEGVYLLDFRSGDFQKTLKLLVN
ncbi:MAG: T9SS type A sorting domain-containing protein [Bacteroidales bacterium]|jgi:hypothetical protein|nr:T9SS type A sorting domain-containing protein [Bacteroidales bacterium]